jgi:hypothetical protein
MMLLVGIGMSLGYALNLTFVKNVIEDLNVGQRSSMIKIISKKPYAWNHSKEPIIVLDKKGVRKTEIEQQLEEAGTNMRLVEELTDIAYERGIESTYED